MPKDSTGSRKEFELVGDERHGFDFRRIQYGPTSLVQTGGLESKSWTVYNPFDAQPLSVRIRARHAVQPFGHEANIVLFNPEDEVEWRTAGMNGAHCSIALSTDVDFEGAPSLRLTGWTTREAPGSLAYARTGLRDEESGREWKDLSEHRSVGLWVYGDGNGEILDIQLVDQSLIRFRDHLVDIDFEGWRYFQLVDAAAEDAFDHSLCPLKRNLGRFNFRRVRELRLQLLAMPVSEDEDHRREVSVHIGRIEALSEISEPLVNPVIQVNTKTLNFAGERALPATFQLHPDEMLELHPKGICKVYDGSNTEKASCKFTEPFLLEVTAGKNTFRLSSNGSIAYAYVTPILRDNEVLS